MAARGGVLFAVGIVAFALVAGLAEARLFLRGARGDGLRQIADGNDKIAETDPSVERTEN
jgi:hypothetical protein